MKIRPWARNMISRCFIYRYKHDQFGNMKKRCESVTVYWIRSTAYASLSKHVNIQFTKVISVFARICDILKLRKISLGSDLCSDYASTCSVFLMLIVQNNTAMHFTFTMHRWPWKLIFVVAVIGNKYWCYHAKTVQKSLAVNSVKTRCVLPTVM